MHLKNKNILLISPEPWEHIFVSKHHYATHLAAKGNKVFFLGPPTLNIKCEPTVFENLFKINYKGFIKGLRFLPARIQRFLIRRKFNAIEKLCKVKFDIVWSFDNSVFFDFSALPRKIFCISHIVDLNQNFQFEKAAKSASLCFGVIPEILDKLSRFNRNSFLIRHGVKKFNFNQTVTLPGENKIKALYAGNMAMPHLNWKVFKGLINQFKFVDFIFIGANLDAVPKDFKNAINLYLIKRVSSDKLPAFLMAADILLLNYTPEYYQNYASPHKTLEYLQSGSVLISNFNTEYQKESEDKLLVICNSDEEYVLKFNEIITNLSFWNSEELKLARMKFASNHFYANKLNQIEDILQSYKYDY